MKVCPCGKKVVKKIAQVPHTADAPDGASAHEAGVGFGHTSRCREICLKWESAVYHYECLHPGEDR